jgi:beta-barrel assembly-enhancing protease
MHMKFGWGGLTATVLALALAGCGTNPVTGKKELQLISEESEVQMGEKTYLPQRQGEGGDFKMDPALTAYVNEVGQKLAAVSDRKLPYEFVVLNNSVPNAWALPGGKIAVNRGLLPQLKDESELAAVLGHEIVHAAARHGAKAQERGTILQMGTLGAQIGMVASDSRGPLAGLAAQGAAIGAQMLQMHYGRDQELEADQYGMVYMQRAGYDLNGAVNLQQTFVRLSQAQGHNQSWLDGMFASHPPSEERVARNKATLKRLGGSAGDKGAERFNARMAPLRKMQPAYDKYDQALALAGKKDFAGARKLAGEAVQLLPREAQFTQLIGDLAMAEKRPADAVASYQKAIELDGSYFGPYLGGGIAQYKLGNKAKAEEWLEKSATLLPTAPAVYYLGALAKDRGDLENARKLFQAAAGSQSEYGQMAAGEFQRMDMPQNPGQYVATGIRQDSSGKVFYMLQNRAQFAVTGIQIVPVVVDGQGQVVQQGAPRALNVTLKPQETLSVDSGLEPMSALQARSLNVQVSAAQPAP